MNRFFNPFRISSIYSNYALRCSHSVAKDFQSPFKKLGLKNSICDRLKWKYPSPIQSKAIPVILRGDNLVSSAQTGTGKTGAYVLPLIQLIEKHLASTSELAEKKVVCCVVTPTRELAMQVQSVFNSLNAPQNKSITTADPDSSVPLSIGVAVGGVPFASQDGCSPHVIVGTIGRLLELVKRNKEDDSKGIDLTSVRHLVIDECDRLISMGFFPDLREFLKHLPKPRNPANEEVIDLKYLKKTGMAEESEWDGRMQTIMVSATLPPSSETLKPIKAGESLNQNSLKRTSESVSKLIGRLAPRSVLIDMNNLLTVPATVEHIVHEVGLIRKKFPLLINVLKRQLIKGKKKIKKERKLNSNSESEIPMHNDQKDNLFALNVRCLVFVRTQQKAERIGLRLNEMKIPTVALHGGLSNLQRREAVDKFNRGLTRVMIATDVASRGIHFEGLKLVVNYDLPLSYQDYVHRVGRTGRLYTPDEEELTIIEKESASDGKDMDLGDDNEMDDEGENEIELETRMDEEGEPEYEEDEDSDDESRGFEHDSNRSIEPVHPHASPLSHLIADTVRVPETTRGRAITFVSLAPQVVVNHHRVVEINDVDMMKKLMKSMGEKLKIKPVPGRWSDSHLTKGHQMLKDQLTVDGIKGKNPSSAKKSLNLAEDGSGGKLRKQTKFGGSNNTGSAALHSNKKERSVAPKNTPNPAATKPTRDSGNDSSVQRASTTTKPTAEIDKEEARRLSLTQDQIASILKVKDPENSGSLLDKLRTRARLRHKEAKLRKKKGGVAEENTKNQDVQINLRDFKQGRYEEMVKEFDVQRAKKRGVHFPKPPRRKKTKPVKLQ